MLSSRTAFTHWEVAICTVVALVLLDRSRCCPGELSLDPASLIWSVGYRESTVSWGTDVSSIASSPESTCLVSTLRSWLACERGTGRAWARQSLGRAARPMLQHQCPGLHGSSIYGADMAAAASPGWALSASRSAAAPLEVCRGGDGP